MQRVLILVLALFVLWRVLRALGKRTADTGLGADSYSRFSPQQRRRRRGAGGDPPGAEPEELVACASCGTFVPRGRALIGDGNEVYCDRGCRDRRAGRSREA